MFNLNRIYNLDCMEAMKEIPDNFFQLAICDPPYGIGHDGQRQRVHNNRKHKLHFVNTRTASNRGRYCSTGKQRRGIAH